MIAKSHLKISFERDYITDMDFALLLLAILFYLFVIKLPLKSVNSIIPIIIANAP